MIGSGEKSASKYGLGDCSGANMKLSLVKKRLFCWYEFVNKIKVFEIENVSLFFVLKISY